MRRVVGEAAFTILLASYFQVFLARRQSAQRYQTIIYSLIKNFLPAIAPDISIAGYINNILNDQLDKYWDTINEKHKAS